MKLFSKIAFFFNLAFIFAVAMRLVERRNDGKATPLSGLQPVENVLVVMGYCAILVNLAFMIAFLVARTGGKAKSVARWIWVFNAAILLVQILYFFVLP